jgi:hypothetical protein
MAEQSKLTDWPMSDPHHRKPLPEIAICSSPARRQEHLFFSQTPRLQLPSVIAFRLPFNLTLILHHFTILHLTTILRNTLNDLRIT